MPNTLDIDDEWGPVDIVIALERAFAIKLEDAEVKDIYQVGPLYDLLVKKVSHDGAGKKCATAMAFYRLRRALAGKTPEKLAPKSALDFLERTRLKRQWKALQEETGFALPPLAMRYEKALLAAGIVALSAIPVVFGGIVLSVWSARLGDLLVHATPYLLIGGIALLIVFAVLDPRRLPDDIRTLGAFAAKTAPRNYGLLAKSGAVLSRAVIWDVMVEVLTDHSNLPPQDVDRETFFLRATMKEAA